LSGEVGAAGTAHGKREVFGEYLRVAGVSPWPFSRRPETSGGSPGAGTRASAGRPSGATPGMLSLAPAQPAL